MNRNAIIIVAGSLTALILGIAIAYPLIVSGFPSLSKVDLKVDVVYAYIEPINSNSTSTGLGWNNSVVEIDYLDSFGGAVQADGLVVSYLVVLNVTNLSDEAVRVRSFDAKIGYQPTAIENRTSSVTWSIVADSRHYTYLAGEDEVWTPHSSRLISLSGVTGVHGVPYAHLNSDVHLYGSVEGQVAYGNPGSYGKADALRQVQFQLVGNGYLYNDLLNEKQILLFYQGLEVFVATRR
ncbi:MAG TPA: hypothetical protein VJL33_07580 [Candidatus Bathyarchaeia archaeon]|nr:hypothetical protein [Candidatus Bathyarchaeia archaeon]